jgi:hypothetical protein
MSGAELTVNSGLLRQLKTAITPGHITFSLRTQLRPALEPLFSGSGCIGLKRLERPAPDYYRL